MQVTVTGESSALKWFKGREAKVRLHVAGGKGEYDLGVEFPLGLHARSPFVSTAASPNASVDIPFVPEARGRYLLTKCSVRTLSPSKFWQASCPKTLSIAIRVFPDLAEESGAKLLFYRKRMGLRRQLPAGRGREFERLREYAPGDTYDEISWKATAHRGKPVVKVFQIERTQDIYVILDASRKGFAHGRLDRFVNGALRLALMVESEGDNFGLLTFHDRVSKFVPAARGMGHFARCRDAIFDLQPSRVTPDFAELFTFLQLHVRRRSLLLFLTDLEDPMLAEAFSYDAQMLARKHVVLVGRMQEEDVRPLFTGIEPHDEAGIHDRLAGHLQWTRLQEVEKRLQRIGVRICALRSDSLGRDLIDQYSQVKRRQIL